MPTAQTILDRKGDSVTAISETATAFEAAQLMSEKKIGSLIVKRGDQIVGIITKRDIVVRVVATQKDPQSTPASQIMTSPVACCTPDTSLEKCMALMSKENIRHLPVVDEGKPCGIITNRDIMSWQARGHKETIVHLNEYLYGSSS